MKFTEYFKKSNKSRGFTLVELLVSIAIIAIMGAILIPVVGHIRNKVDNATCINNMRQLGLAVTMFAQENNGQLPLSIQPDQSDPESMISWQILMMRQLEVPFAKHGDTSVFICPSHSHTYPVEAYRTYAINLTGDSPTSNAPNLMTLSTPSKTALLVESKHESNGAGYVSLSRSVNGGSGQHRLEARHDGMMNMFMADGHMDSMSVEDEHVEAYLVNIRK